MSYFKKLKKRLRAAGGRSRKAHNRIRWAANMMWLSGKRRGEGHKLDRLLNLF